MPVRTIIALVSSPFYGFLVALATIPIMVVGAFAIGLLSIASLILPLIIAVLSFVVQAAIYAQSARYAASITGLRSIIQQGDFFRAVGKCLFITVVVGITSGLVLVAFFVVYLQFGGAEEFWWLDREKLVPAVQIAMDSPAAAEAIFSFENMNIGSLFFIMKIFSMFFISLIAIFAVPRAAMLDDKFQRTYTLGLILARLFIAFPFCAAMTGVISHLFMFLLQTVLDVVGTNVEATTMTLYVLELTLYTGMVFAFEANLLKMGHEQDDDEVEWNRMAVQADNPEIRAIREAWNQRT